MIDISLQLQDLREFLHPDEPLAPRLSGDFINHESARVELVIDDDTTQIIMFGSWWSPDALDGLANLLTLTAEAVRKNT